MLMLFIHSPALGSHLPIAVPNTSKGVPMPSPRVKSALLPSKTLPVCAWPVTGFHTLHPPHGADTIEYYCRPKEND